MAQTEERTTTSAAETASGEQRALQHHTTGADGQTPRVSSSTSVVADTVPAVGTHPGWTRQRSSLGQLTVRALLIGLLLAMGVTLFSTHDTAAARQAAQRQHARLNDELRHASHDLGIPDAALMPVIVAEQKLAADSTSFTHDDRADANTYSSLLMTVRTIEAGSVGVIHEKMLGDLEYFKYELDRKRTARFSELAFYQSRLDTALAQADAARDMAAYAQVDGFVSAQVDALRAMDPAYQQLQDFTAYLRTLRLAGIASPTGERACAADRLLFRDAAPASAYDSISTLIAAQQAQVRAEQVSALATGGPALLASLHSGIRLLSTSGEGRAAATLQQDYDQDAALLVAAQTPGAYVAVARMVDTQVRALALPLLRAQTRRDGATLVALIAVAQSRYTINPYDGRGYPDGYEYADGKTGYGAIQKAFAAAHTLADVQAADDDTTTLIMNLHAMLDNLRDPTPMNKPHASDVALMQHDNLLQGKVLIISLREQAMRLYDHGTLVKASYVTTGRIELPSPPGLHYAMNKGSPVLFVSPEPRTSPFWFEPTPVRFAIQYAPDADFLHDASWRSSYGPGSNLPHYDPISFNGGSHGCINIPAKTMEFVYDWTQVGTPVLVY